MSCDELISVVEGALSMNLSMLVIIVKTTVATTEPRAAWLTHTPTLSHVAILLLFIARPASGGLVRVLLHL